LLLLLLLLIKSASKICSIVTTLAAATASSERCGFVDGVDNQATRPLILKISCVVLVYHFIKKIVIDQISFACRVLLVLSNGGCFVLSLKAYWRCIQTVVIIKLARKFRTEWRLLLQPLFVCTLFIFALLDLVIWEVILI